MVFRLDSVVPWDRNLAEYRAMFGLNQRDLAGSIPGCADGPASFNAELTNIGGKIISADPLYAFAAEDIKLRIDQTSAEVLAQTRRNKDQFVWKTIASVEELGRIRMAAMDCFLSDYDAGHRAGRYVAASLPALPFADKCFDLVLCSHFLFLYSDMLDRNFHYSAIRELCRVAGEVRIFPLLGLVGATSLHLPPVAEMLERCGYAVSVQAVDYEFQKGGDQMLRVCGA
jgi:hypothetical protein